MNELIRITRTSIYEYAPNFDDEFYKEHNVTTLEQAILIDQNGVKDGEVGLEELSTSDPTITDIWEIVGNE